MTFSPVKLFIGSVLLFFIFYFGLSKVAPEVRNPEKSGLLENIDINLDQEVLRLKDSLSEPDRTSIELMEHQLSLAANDSSKLSTMQSISGFWYRQGQVGLSAKYARKIAMTFPSGENWAIAATNFILAAKQPEVPTAMQAEYVEQALMGFKQAQILEPTEISHQVNSALIHVEFPPQDQPMTGILELRKLNETYPDNTLVMYHLARLAIQTGQWDKATERLDALIKLDPDYTRAYCLYLEIARHDGDRAAITKWTKKCELNQN